MNTTAVVTGANRGIGRAITTRLLADGFTVAGLHRSGDLPEGAHSYTADLTDAASVSAAFEQIRADLGPVGVLVANAGITKDGLLARMSEEDFAAVLDTNLTGTFRCVKAAAKDMMRERYGRIVLISSVVATYGGFGQVNYAAAKSGLIGMARSIARELGARGVTANVIAPGFVETDMTASLPDKIVADYKSRIPAGRFAAPEEIAAAVAFLASKDAGYVNGTVVNVDGGLGMGH
ncbi:beta-ketoacyl-ACP reductase [Bowdeniella nasicola]|uniref:Beta-ketoacyl-ACP reductase n=1 Tax=Bowdeniella nasicola TaxID=208480 RepID=A0A1Q5Q513_9ACTO|nr:3-oxoacyl-ACP reductase FabG [Bowdeniella nasicola]OKL54792.1 beta-ketoacyl-ACP reductase [Bowdeniella nasicola]